LEQLGKLNLSQALLLPIFADRITELEPELDIGDLFGRQAEEFFSRSYSPSTSFETSLLLLVHGYSS
jgi:hypothetical protein